LTEVVVVKDQWTGKSRGFGFVTFVFPRIAEYVVSLGQHFVDGKYVDVKKVYNHDNQNMNDELQIQHENEYQFINMPSNYPQVKVVGNRPRTRSNSGNEYNLNPTTAAELEYCTKHHKIFVGGLHFKTNNGI